MSACWLKIEGSGFGRCVSLCCSLSLRVTAQLPHLQWRVPTAATLAGLARRWSDEVRLEEHFLNSKGSEVLDNVMSGPAPWGVVSKHTDLFLSQIFWETGSFFLTLAKMNNKQESSLQMTLATSRRKTRGELKALPLSNSSGWRETS